MLEKELEDAVTYTINKLVPKMDATNELLRGIIRQIVIKDEIDRLLLGSNKLTQSKLPGCREMLGDFLDLPLPSDKPVVPKNQWKFMDETKSAQSR
jgi:hypothetical protein